MNSSRIIGAIDNFKDLKILVIGDFILDAYYKGHVDRVSPEAPVPILDVDSKEFRLGGAANVARNLSELGAEAILCSVVGIDDPGKLSLDLMTQRGLTTLGIVKSAKRPTSVKTRLMSEHVQMLRMDEEITSDLSDQEESALLNSIVHLMDTHSPTAVVFEDYNKGVLTEVVIKKVIELSKARGIITAVDPKRQNFFTFAGVSLFKPNMKELKEGLNMPNLDAPPVQLDKAFTALKEQMAVDVALFTLSADGVYITADSSSHHIGAIPRNIADVSGAGDTVIATATCALASGLNLEETAFLANLAGGWVCQFPGVVPITKDALKIETDKIL